MKPEKIERRPIIAERLELLRDLFPDVFTDGRVALDRLKELLEDNVIVSPVDEHYALNWPGKQQARRLANQPPHVTLRPVPEAGVDEDATGNVVIVGDNLQVLLSLQKSYASSIKLVYIDPPYNTGNDFIYKDTFAVGEELYLRETRQADLHGRLVSNPQTSGRFHSNWLSFMYPRLAVAQRLLREDGLIFVSIDDGEVANLRLAMNTIFGEENFIANVIWQKKYTRANDAEFFSDNHDHILVFAKNRSAAGLNLQPRSDEQKAAYSNPDNHPKGPWKSTPLHAKSGVNRSEYEFKNGVRWAPPRGTFRRFSDATMAAMEVGDEIYFGVDGKGTPSRKSFLSEVKQGVTPVTLWLHDEVGHNHEANNELKALMGDGVFDNPKPTRLIKRILDLATDSLADDVVLDFFAGSGTTGDAVMQKNREDGGNRRFILVQFPEPIRRVPSGGITPFETIDKITCERLRRVAKAMKAEGAKGDLGFRVFKEDSPALARPLHLAAEQLDKGQLEMFKEKIAHVQPANLFAEVLLLLGFPLDTNREQVPQGSANTLWRFEHPRVPQPLLLCLDQKIDDDLLEALRDKSNHIFVCRDQALTDVSKARFYDALKRVDSTFKVL